MGRNILFISNESTLGGAAQSLIDMLKALKCKSINPFVIIPSHGIIEERLQELGVVYYVVPFMNGYGLIGNSTRADEDRNFHDNYYAALQLQEIIKKEKIELIHINSSVSNVGAFAALMAGIPYVWHFREFLEEDFDCEFWDKELKIKLIRQANKIITISKTVSQSYKQKYDIESIQIYNGIDTQRYQNNLCEDVAPLENHFIITGAITGNKGQWDAVKAVKVLREEGIDDIHLTLAGGGDAKCIWAMEKFIEINKLFSYVEIKTFQKDLSELRKNSMYALTTSKMEALGRCTIEAMLAGQIVIGADTGGTKEIIGTDESRGYLYKQGDYHSLAAVMKRALLETDEKKDFMRKNAQEYAEETFSLETYADKTCMIYEKVMMAHTNRDKKAAQKLLNELEERYKTLNYKTEVKVSDSNKYKYILDKWNRLEEKGLTVSDFLKAHRWKKVAIYGMGNLGCRLYEEIKASGIEVAYVIDRNPEFLEDLVAVRAPQEEPTEVDVIIVTVSKEEQEIVRSYKEKYNCNILGLSQILEGMMNA